jgi:hypothetical protein
MATKKKRRTSRKRTVRKKATKRRPKSKSRKRRKNPGVSYSAVYSAMQKGKKDGASASDKARAVRLLRSKLTEQNKLMQELREAPADLKRRARAAGMTISTGAKKATKKKAASGAKKKKSTKKKSTKKKSTKKKASTRRASSRRKKKRGYGPWSKARGARYASAVRSARKAGRKKPTRKSKATLRRGWTMSKSRKAKYIREGKLGKGGRANPGRRRRKKRKKNPSLMGAFKQLGQPNFWIAGAQTVAGMGAAIVVPSVLEQVAGRVGMGRYVRNSGAQGVALTAVSTALVTFGAQFVETQAIKRGILPRAFRGLSSRAAMGGMIVTILKAAEVFARQYHSKLNLPSIPAPVNPIRALRAPAPPAAANGTAGMGDWMQLRGMGDWMQLRGMGGMGGATPAEHLVAGESFARSMSQFDGMGDYRIPMEGIRAPNQLLGMYPGQYGGFLSGGMGDHVELLAKPGSAAALAMTGGAWEPSPMETF